MSEQAKTSIFKKDKNNNLSNKQCVDFIKNYKDFKNGIVSKITNPKTDKPLNNEDRIKYIYNYCKQKLGIEGSLSSKSTSSDSSTNEIILDSYKKVKEIIYIPFNNLKENKELIASLFSKPIQYEKGLLKLSEYLSNPNSHNIYVKSYNKILLEINDIINSIYNNHNQNNQKILKRGYGWVENYSYDPLLIFDTSQEHNIQNAIKTSKIILTNMWVNTYYIDNTDIRSRGLNINNKLINNLCNMLFYSPTNKNKADFIKNLNDNMERYIALQFILIIIRDGIDVTRTYNYNNMNLIENHLEILDSLITKSIVNVLFNNNNNSQSISNSISWSGTPRSSSSGHSHFQSKANIDRYKKTKAELVAEITANNINDMDPYLAERWEDMPLGKLRNVISIKHTEGANSYKVAFHVISLYKAWRISVKDNKPFKNPYTRKAFTENDKEYILNSMKILYPNIEIPKIGNGRSDIIVEINYIGQENRENYIFKYKLNLGNEKNILINLLSFSIPYNFNVEVEPAYIQEYLYENITYLEKNNKLFGKGMPLKIIPGLKEYIGKNIVFSRYNYKEYKVFFDKIKDAI
jgi:hypothetical protein